jgi:hypothetical protein
MSSVAHTGSGGTLESERHLATAPFIHHRTGWQVIHPAMLPDLEKSSSLHQKPMTALPRYAAMPTCLLPTHFLEDQQ